MGEINLFPYTMCPQNWAWCNGQILPISQNTALFALLGITYGGNGKTTFALPNLNGSVALHPGQGPGLSERHLGEVGGSETVTLSQAEMPWHVHSVNAAPGPATTANPVTSAPATSEVPLYHSTGGADSILHPSGSDLPHNNMQPYLTLYYAIALQGVFPTRS
ncbi:phage tail protein [Nocardioides sp. SYSU D00065]|uniref:phage tail protein n=1 Tax=Nocardioides sp. SYSU D00065 TaxID=2817378 RepID=UPI001B33A63B|nr:tail fiber protein [Nocardioides sp. SYSU D00065]